MGVRVNGCLMMDGVRVRFGEVRWGGGVFFLGIMFKKGMDGSKFESCWEGWPSLVFWVRDEVRWDRIE